MELRNLALLIALLGALIGSLSQYLLKRAANRDDRGKLGGLLQPQVLLAYALFLVVVLGNLFTLRHLPLFLLPLIEASSYVYVALIAHFLLRERIGRRRLLGLALIILGVILASI